jgi:hypothetical protein
MSFITAPIVEGIASLVTEFELPAFLMLRFEEQEIELAFQAEGNIHAATFIDMLIGYLTLVTGQNITRKTSVSAYGNYFLQLRIEPTSG